MELAEEVNRPWHQHRLKLLLGIIAAYLLIAYVFIPQLGKFELRRHPPLYDGDRITRTSTGEPGDPLNIAIVASEADLILAIHAAGWRSADPLTFKTSARIVIDTVLDKPDEDAPVSNLFLLGRREDLAFERPVGTSPRKRHHVRFWNSGKLKDGRPVWMGSAAFDIGVELSRTTGQVTHHIAKEIDVERDLLVGNLQSSGRVVSAGWIDGFHHQLSGKNGGGDPWSTDGRLAELTLKATEPTAAK